MINPEYPINITKGQWNLVATNIKLGTLRRDRNFKFDHFHTYRITGDIGVPTELGEGAIMFQLDEFESIEADSGIDVYVWPSKDSILRLDR